MEFRYCMELSICQIVRVGRSHTSDQKLRPRSLVFVKEKKKPNKKQDVCVSKEDVNHVL